ncbi:cytochrome p450 domain-containing protein [Ditylenchus destructor]|uniref:Cytochrome p450 domain-containing protein n=1 Tax=Ditylenchus destructor TaxID=166010 RepID=A0AAD4QX18_9BILA|nr:cytochrome p450 domain-containing protein [Ditylenchus destructor]
MILFILLLSFLWLCFYNFYYKRRNLPPGPIPLPLFGNALSIFTVTSFEEMYIKWQKKYGNVYTYWQAETPMVVIADFNTIQETLQRDGDSYTGRQNLENFNRYLTGLYYHVQPRFELRNVVLAPLLPDRDTHRFLQLFYF